MIKLTRINNKEFYLNPHLIEKVEETPDTVITMQSQIQYIVKESIEEINKKIIDYRNKLSIQKQE